MTLSQWLTGLGAALTAMSPVIATQLDLTTGVIIGVIGLGLTTFNDSLRVPAARSKSKVVEKKLSKDK